MDIPRKEKRIDFVDGMGPDGGMGTGEIRRTCWERILGEMTEIEGP